MLYLFAFAVLAFTFAVLAGFWFKRHFAHWRTKKWPRHIFHAGSAHDDLPQSEMEDQ